MKTFVYHFCGPINEHIAIPRTVWDDLIGSCCFGYLITRWHWKTAHLTGGEESVIRELSQIRHGKIVEVGCFSAHVVRRPDCPHESEYPRGPPAWCGGRLWRGALSRLHGN